MRRSVGVLFSTALVTSSLFATQVQAAPEKYKDVRALLANLAARFPAHAKVVSIGDSDAGLPIEGLAIGQGPVKNLVVATHHGNEYGSTEVAKALATSLAESPILGQTIYVIPVLNTSGYDLRQRWERVNGSYFDANRDYPGPCGGEGPFRLKSTAALARFKS